MTQQTMDLEGTDIPSAARLNVSCRYNEGDTPPWGRGLSVPGLLVLTDERLLFDARAKIEALRHRAMWFWAVLCGPIGYFAAKHANKNMVKHMEMSLPAGRIQIPLSKVRSVTAGGHRWKWFFDGKHYPHVRIQWEGAPGVPGVFCLSRGEVHQDPELIARAIADACRSAGASLATPVE